MKALLLVVRSIQNKSAAEFESPIFGTFSSHPFFTTDKGYGTQGLNTEKKYSCRALMRFFFVHIFCFLLVVKLLHLQNALAKGDDAMFYNFFNSKIELIV